MTFTCLRTKSRAEGRNCSVCFWGSWLSGLRAMSRKLFTFLEKLKWLITVAANIQTSSEISTFLLFCHIWVNTKDGSYCQFCRVATTSVSVSLWTHAVFSLVVVERENRVDKYCTVDSRTMPKSVRWTKKHYNKMIIWESEGFCFVFSPYFYPSLIFLKKISLEERDKLKPTVPVSCRPSLDVDPPPILQQQRYPGAN